MVARRCQLVDSTIDTAHCILPWSGTLHNPCSCTPAGRAPAELRRKLQPVLASCYHINYRGRFISHAHIYYETGATPITFMITIIINYYVFQRGDIHAHL